ncbi:MAG: glycoside-pentoside-hexuronide (GPH):cation symporter [Hespellia sp.]|nr:glycoside-pentoside-hexuronide (GPH):cation symporter [Hespellia sp.]
MKVKKSKNVISWKEKIAFGLGDAGCNFIWTVVGSFLTLYYTDNVGISAAVIGIIMLVTRIFDGVSDLVMGEIIDHTHTKWGKARPWILFTAPFMMIGLIFLFNVPTGFSTTGKIVYATITYIFLTVFVFTACSLSYYTLPSLISNCQDDRTVLNSVRFIFNMITALIISYAAVPLVKSVGWGKMSAVYAVSGMVFLLITFFGTKERVTMEECNIENKSSLGIGESLRLLLKNKYFIYLVILFTMTNCANGVIGGMTIFFVRDVMKNESIYGTMMMCGMLPVILGMLIFPSLARRFGKWKCMIAGFILQIIGFIIIYFCATNTIVVLVASAIKGLGGVPASAGLYALIGDVVDYGEWKNDVRLDGLTYSVSSFGMKVGTGLGAAILGWGLAIGKYTAGAATQSAYTLQAFKILFSLIPLVLIVIAMIALLRTNLDKIFPQIQKELEERRNKK